MTVLDDINLPISREDTGYILASIAPGTRANYETVLKKFVSWCKRSRENPENLSTTTIKRYNDKISFAELPMLFKKPNL